MSRPAPNAPAREGAPSSAIGRTACERDDDGCRPPAVNAWGHLAQVGNGGSGTEPCGNMQSQHAAPPLARSTLTPEALAAFWPAAHDRLVRALRARGVDLATAEDAVAEAAARALSRGLAADNVDDFCRWAFVVARNLVFTSHRRAERLVPLESAADRAADYDLARHVEVREQWQATASAIGGLSTADRLALAGTLEDGTTGSRREAVREAVRRHRARARLRHALGHVGGFLGWRRRPHPWTAWNWGLAWTSPEYAGVALLIPIILGMGTTPAPDTGRVATAPVVGPSAAPAPDATTPGAHGQPGAEAARSERGGLHPAPPSAPVPTAADAAADRGGAGFEFTPSPSYERDSTVFATGSDTGCMDPTRRCPLLLKSQDGGRSWKRLDAVGRDYGAILLPRGYPNDNRIFSVGTVLSVSRDGGSTFEPIGAVPGPGTIAPGTDAAETRIVFASTRNFRTAAPMEYNDELPTLVPLATGLPLGAVPLKFRYDPARPAGDHLFAVAAETGAGLVENAPGGIEATSLYSCRQEACERVLELGAAVLEPDLVWSQRRRDTMLVGTTFAIHRSSDGGRTFQALPVPGHYEGRMLIGLVAAPDGRFFAIVHDDPEAPTNTLFASHDDGATWEKVPTAGFFYSLAALPDGNLLDAMPGDDGGIRCSSDGGLRWSRRCGDSG